MDHKPISVSANSTAIGTFAFNFSTLASYDHVIACNITTKETDQFKSANSSLVLTEPNFNGTAAIQLSHSFVNVGVKGKIKAPSG
jgi:hypothetical protein